MKTKIVEATQPEQFNWGRFLVGIYSEDELQYQSRLSPGETVLHSTGYNFRSIWVMDLVTGEGAQFTPSSYHYAKSDLDKHKIWVCPMFEPFLEYLYQNWTGNLDDLPNLVEIEALADFRGYRRTGE